MLLKKSKCFKPKKRKGKI